MSFLNHRLPLQYGHFGGELLPPESNLAGAFTLWKKRKTLPNKFATSHQARENICFPCLEIGQPCDFYKGGSLSCKCYKDYADDDFDGRCVTKNTRTQPRTTQSGIKWTSLPQGGCYGNNDDGDDGGKVFTFFISSLV